MDTEQKAETLEFAPLKLHPNYVISTTEPFIIRRIKDGKFMKYSKNNSGYIYLSIDFCLILHDYHLSKIMTLFL